MQETDLPPEPEDTESAQLFSYALTVIALEQALRNIPDGLTWLALLEQGYKATEAARLLKRNSSWLARVREACRQALG